MQIFPDCGCGCKGKEQQKKFTRALMLGFLFFIIANPETFTIMRRALGGSFASVTGYPTIKGLILHSFVFFLISWLLMNIPGREKMEGDAPAWVKQTSNTSPDNVPLTNWSPTDSTGGAPPASIAGGPVPNPTTLPELGMPNTPAQETDVKSWSGMNKTLGGLNINSENMLSSGTNWQMCACPSGKNVMVMN